MYGLSACRVFAQLVGAAAKHPVVPTPNALRYVASDDPESYRFLRAADEALNATSPSTTHLTFHQLELKVFHVDKWKKRVSKAALARMYTDVVSEHFMLSLCDAWVMPGSGYEREGWCIDRLLLSVRSQV